MGLFASFPPKYINFALMNTSQTANEVIRIDVGQVLRNRLPRMWRFIPRQVVNWLERTICQDQLNALLEANAGKTGAAFCRGILESLDITVDVAGAENLPPKGNRRVVFVCNHPLGGLDGMALIDIIHRHYGGQVWFVVNDLLMAVKPLESVFLPINKFGGQSRRSFRRLDEAFDGNDPIIIFPAGLVSRYRKVPVNGRMKKMVCDLEWRKTFINRCVQSKRDIVPLFFSGQNSMDFYKKANLRKKLGIKFNIEMVYLPREMFLARGKSFKVYVGVLKPHTTIQGGRFADGYARAIATEAYLLPQEFYANNTESAHVTSDN